MTRPMRTATVPLIRFGNFAFTIRAIRNAIRRDRQALSVGRASPFLPCGVRLLARIERWLEASACRREWVAEFPSRPGAAQFGFGPAVWRWFNRLVREGRYRKARCRSCGCDYPKGQLESRTGRSPGIRVRGHGPTGARWERWRCCPRGHRIVRLGYKVSRRSV
jgi:hypothetical protein